MMLMWQANFSIMSQVLSLLADSQLTTLTKAAGVELNRPLVWWSRLTAWRRGYGNRATFHHHDLWTFDFSPFQTVIIFGVDVMVNLALSLIPEIHCV